jgi:hypothetical protein
MVRNFTDEEIKERRRKKGENIFYSKLNTLYSDWNTKYEILGTFQKQKTPLRCKCLKCSYIWDPVPESLLRGSSCGKCANSITDTHDEFVYKFKKMNKKLYDTVEILSKYISSSHKIKLKCKVCNRIWNANPRDCKNKGNGCSRCSGK